MTEYLISFNQQWVGDHSEEWSRERGPLAAAVVGEMKKIANPREAALRHTDGRAHRPAPVGHRP